MPAVTGLRALTLDQIAESFATADDDLIKALGAECKRRDRLDRAKRARQADPIAAEWHLFAHAQYLAAEAATNGFLLNRRGLAAGIEPWSLWSGPARQALAYASYELAEFWSANSRLTVGEYRRQIAAGHRIEADEHEREAVAAVPGAHDLVAAVRASGAGALDACPAEFLAELLDAEHAAEWLGIKRGTVYQEVKRNRWPAPDRKFGQSGTWSRKTLVLHRASMVGVGAPGKPRAKRRSV